MIVDIYQSTTSRKKYLSVPAGTDLLTLTIPDKDYQTVSPFKLGQKIAAADGRSAYDSAAAIDAINADGYYLHQASISITTRVR